MKKFLAVMLVLLTALTALSCGEKTQAAVCVPIFMYHHIGDHGDPNTTVDAATFEAQIMALSGAGFEAVSFERLIAYVDGFDDLPEKPVCIVFDDGYLSNYLYAYPILKQYGMYATVSVIGSGVGATEYKNTGVPIIPHFSWAQAREMHVSGYVGFASHTFDMHMNASLQSGCVREHCARLPHESAKSFTEALMRDHILMSDSMKNGIGTDTTVFAYPHGIWDSCSENTLRGLGYRVTLISDEGMNTVVFGDPDSLYLMRRYTVAQSTDFYALLESVSRYTD